MVRTNLPGPKGSDCFSMGVRTSISKETYSHVIFQGSGPFPLSSRAPLDPPMLASERMQITAWVFSDVAPSINSHEQTSSMCGTLD